MEDNRPWWRQAGGKPAWVRRFDAAPAEKLWRFYAGATIVLIALVVISVLSGMTYLVAFLGPTGIFGGKAIRGWRLARRPNDHSPA